MNDDIVRINLNVQDFYIQLNNIIIYGKGLSINDTIEKLNKLLQVFLTLINRYDIPKKKDFI